jgi:hypothetical protein
VKAVKEFEDEQHKLQNWIDKHQTLEITTDNILDFVGPADKYAEKYNILFIF